MAIIEMFNQDETKKTKTYLGDSVYVEFDEDTSLGRLILTTENGLGATNTIVLEPEVYGALLTFVDSLKQGDD